MLLCDKVSPEEELLGAQTYMSPAVRKMIELTRPIIQKPKASEFPSLSSSPNSSGNDRFAPFDPV